MNDEEKTNQFRSPQGFSPDNRIAYLRTNHWQHRRLMALRRAGWRCQVCNEEASKGKPLDVHHRTYERRGAEKAEDVIVLCRRCHELFHTTVGVVDK